MRNAIIVSCLLLSAVLGTAAILSHRWALQSVIFCIGCVWLLANVVASGMYRKRFWKARDISLSQLYRDAKRGGDNLPALSGVELVTGVGSTILMLVFFALYFI
jgi:hypothetical protein